MKRLFYFILCVGVWLPATAQVFTPQDAQAIRLVLAEQEAAWNRGDILGFMEGYWRSDSLSFVGKSGITRGWDKTLARYQDRYPDKAAMGTLTFEILELTSLEPGSAVLIGRWELLRAEDNPGGYFTLIWRKILGKWVIVSDHTSG